VTIVREERATWALHPPFSTEAETMRSILRRLCHRQRARAFTLTADEWRKVGLK
jgi:hypothetical protein